MTRLYNYIEEYTPLLMEKVSKQDINEMLNNTDILVGAEFEFIADNIEGGPNEEIIGEYDAAYHDWQNYNDEVRTYQQESEDLWKEYADIEEQINDLDPDDEDFDEQKEKLEQDLKEKEGERDELFPPSMGQDYINYMENIGYDTYIETGEEADEPPDPADMEYDNEVDVYALEGWISKINPKPPFGRDYAVEDYGGFRPRPGMTTWGIEPDSSLSDGGVEIKSPPMTMKDFVKVCPKMFKWIKDVGTTDSSCGFHIHMSLKNRPNLESVLDLSKLIMFTDEEYIYKFFKSRQNSTYATSVKGAMNREAKLLDKKALLFDRGVMSQHFNSINWQGISDNHGHIEFRYLGGTDYHRKWEKIKVIIAQYAYNLNLATNPEFKWKEYKTKLARLYNKLEQEKRITVAFSLRNILDVSHKWKINNTKSDKYLMGIAKKIADGKISNVDWFDNYSKKEYVLNVLEKWYQYIDRDKLDPKISYKFDDDITDITEGM